MCTHIFSTGKTVEESHIFVILNKEAPTFWVLSCKILVWFPHLNPQSKTQEMLLVYGWYWVHVHVTRFEGTFTSTPWKTNQRLEGGWWGKENRHCTTCIFKTCMYMYKVDWILVRLGSPSFQTLLFFSIFDFFSSVFRGILNLMETKPELIQLITITWFLLQKRA